MLTQLTNEYLDTYQGLYAKQEEVYLGIKKKFDREKEAIKIIKSNIRSQLDLASILDE
jgi:hypothetical protein